MSEKQLPSLMLQTIAAMCSREVLRKDSIEVDLTFSFEDADRIRVEPHVISFEAEDIENLNPIHNETLNGGYFIIDHEDFEQLLDGLMSILPNYEAIEADAGLDIRDRFKRTTWSYLEDMQEGSNLMLAMFIDSDSSCVAIESSLVLAMEIDEPPGEAHMAILSTDIQSVFE